jgi:predicted porin
MQGTWRQVAAIALLGWSTAALSNDFPLQLDEAETLAARAWEFETALEVARLRSPEGKARETELEIQLAYGLASNLTIELDLPVTRSLEADGSQISGVGDATASAKWRFYKRGSVHLGVKAALSLPTGSQEKELGTGKLGGGIALLASIEEEGRYELHANLGVAMPRYEDADRQAAARRSVPRVAVGAVLDLNDDWRVAAGWEAVRSEQRAESRWDQSLAIGAVYDLGQGAALAARVLFTRAGQERGTGVGLAYALRF